MNDLWSNGCNLYQGYYFSKPLAADRFLDGVQTASASILNLVNGRVRGVDGAPLSMAS